ncbi:MAG TPA: hypothetical protein PK453_05435 [Leptospiraceae bacterium]|nr:hypothetical protein [Leptospiraceae bacterium]HMY68901.1 hypothetical protein [Leptospiraceae bacterium]HNF13091.1 hypothetical protein [Leptospiraceae bacterium]HNF23079.1 hypothetical protein [Leptospiraceae bacterium]HNH07899.1 hypothetical protein [Leptospiraceae bacterium]
MTKKFESYLSNHRMLSNDLSFFRKAAAVKKILLKDIMPDNLDLTGILFNDSGMQVPYFQNE